MMQYYHRSVTLAVFHLSQISHSGKNGLKEDAGVIQSCIAFTILVYISSNIVQSILCAIKFSKLLIVPLKVEKQADEANCVQTHPGLEQNEMKHRGHPLSKTSIRDVYHRHSFPSI